MQDVGGEDVVGSIGVVKTGEERHDCGGGGCVYKCVVMCGCMKLDESIEQSIWRELGGYLSPRVHHGWTGLEAVMC